MRSGAPYTTHVVKRARALREAGWSYDKVCELLEQEFGRRPQRVTVEGWLDEKIAEKRRRLVREERNHPLDLPVLREPRRRRPRPPSTMGLAGVSRDGVST